jgi:phage terminase large subunit-like protein
MTDVDPNLWKRWTPAAQQRALEQAQSTKVDEWRPFYCKCTDPVTGLPSCDGMPHDVWEWNHARGDQHPPTDLEWVLWLLAGGRGSGKTRGGSEYTQRMTEETGRIALVAATGPDGREIMVEGESGLIATARPGKVPIWEPSKKRLTWPNGCKATVFSAEEPDRLRGPEHGFAWVDEPAHMALIQAVWDNLLFGLRIGRRPRIVATTTPKPRPWLKTQIKDPRTRHVKVSTYANLANLAPIFAERIINRYEGTRLGRQELHGDVLEDVEGALWNYDLIEPDRVVAVPHLVRVLVAVDPAGSAHRASDETGIVAVGKDRIGHMYVLKDRSGKYSPNGWALAVDALCDEVGADVIVAEKNYGGELVRSNMRNAGITRRIKLVDSRKGKALRAEPVVSLYEQHKVHHAGVFVDLEDQQCTWEAYEDDDSPDRVDALVHGITELAGKGGMSSIASPSTDAQEEVRSERRQRRHMRARVRAS